MYHTCRCCRVFVPRVSVSPVVAVGQADAEGLEHARQRRRSEWGRGRADHHLLRVYQPASVRAHRGPSHQRHDEEPGARGARMLLFCSLRPPWNHVFVGLFLLFWWSPSWTIGSTACVRGMLYARMFRLLRMSSLLGAGGDAGAGAGTSVFGRFFLSNPEQQQQRGVAISIAILSRLVCSRNSAQPPKIANTSFHLTSR